VYAGLPPFHPRCHTSERLRTISLSVFGRPFSRYFLDKIPLLERIRMKSGRQAACLVAVFVFVSAWKLYQTRFHGGAGCG
jgi:hypothetical protein